MELVQICKQLKLMKIPVYIVISLALVWFGGAGLAFATFPNANSIPACPCNHSHGESGCCCEQKAPQKSAPACSVKHAPVAACACNYDRDASSATAVTVYRTADPAIILDSAVDTSDPVAFANDQAFPALPSSNSVFTPLRI